MAFPATALPVRSRLFINGQWIDFSNSTLIRKPIEIWRGTAPEGVRPDPSTCGLSLRNQSGDLSPRKPTGQYYELFGDNTPIQVVLDEASDDFNRTSSNGWGTSSSGHTWATSGGVAGNYAVSGGNATIAISAVNSARITALNVSLADCDVVATYKPGVVATGAAIQMATMLRYQDDNNLYQVVLLFNTDSTVTAAIVKRVGGTNTTLAATGVLGYYTSTSQWRMRAKVCGQVFTVRAWDAVTGTEPSTFDTWGTDTADDAITTAGKIGCRMLLQTGNTNTLNLTVTTSSLEVVHHRFNGEVPVWPVDWDLSGSDVWTPISAAGLLRRVNKSQEPLSPLRRLLQGTTQTFGGAVDSVSAGSLRRPVGYWPLEDPTGTSVASSAVPGGQPMTITGTVSWAAIDDIDGSSPLPDMMDSAAVLTGIVPAQIAATGAWTVGAILTPPTLASTWTPLAWKVDGNSTYDRFELRVTTGGNYEVYGFAGTSSTLLITTSIRDLASRPTAVLVQAAAFNSDVDYRLVTSGDGYVNEYTSTTTAVGAVAGYPTQVTVTSVAAGGSNTAGLGHVQVWDGWFSLLADSLIIQALQAHDGDQGHLRLARLFDQAGIPFIYIGDTSDQVGKQAISTLPDLVDDVLVVDKGVMFEARDENAIIYVTRRARYNLPTTLALTYGTSGHLAPGFKPVPDDRDVVNDLTIQRDGGASGRYELTTGRRSVNAPPTGAGRYPRKKTLPLYDDTQPYQHAAWEVITAAWDEPRYPSVNVNMARSARDAATVYEQAKRLDVGGRLTVASAPAWLPPDTIDLHALGLTEVIGGGSKIGAYHWAIGAQAVPAGPYMIGTLDTSTRDKLASAGCELMIDRNSTDTTFTVHTTVAPKWKTGAGLSIPMLISGEKITATTIANVTPSFVGVGTSDHDSNAAITPTLPASWQPGDLLLLFTAIRNSPTGFANAPDNTWDLLLDMANVRLFGKYAQSGESTPTVTFTAGVANATTSGTIAAFRGVGRTVHKKATPLLNAAAQNIAYPGLTVTRDNCLVLVLGWKQDDWTSVATLAGFSEIGEPSSTTGDDQGLVWDYVLQSTATSIPSGSFTVTGGTSQISRGGVIALASDVQTLTVTRSVNTVAKSQSNRKPINVYQPLRLGL